MSWNNRVVWSEGMFLRPQHFQQHLRYVESLVEGRCSELTPYPWGFTELSVDHKLLPLGKLSIASARGVFPDGTPFSIPNDDEPPPAIDVDENLRDTIVYLSLAARRPGTVEVAHSDGEEGMARYRGREREFRDTHTLAVDNVAPLQVSSLRLKLLTEQQRLDEYLCLGVARVVEVRSDKTVVLDQGYLPPTLDCQAIPGLAAFLKELQGLLHQRGEALAGRVSASGRGGAAEIADFLLLQCVNRFEPVIHHLAQLEGLHPERLFGLALSMAGELATFTRSNKRPAAFPRYRHDDLRGVFEPLMAALRESLSMVLEQTAVALPLEDRKYGIRVSPIVDRSLLASASFVLAVHANIPTEELRNRFPAQLKIGAVEHIRQLVNLQLPGIGIRPLPVAPRQIPYHSGYVYFELDRSGEHWAQLQQSGGIAMHLAGDFPGLEMNFWAIRG